jgi:hypothetical protein
MAMVQFLQGFDDLLYSCRYHIIGAILFLIFCGAFVAEAFAEARTSQSRRRRRIPGSGHLSP